MLFEKLASRSLLIKLEKYEFGRTYLDFLGHRIDKTGARPLSTKIDAICNFLPPKSTKLSTKIYHGITRGITLAIGQSSL